MDSDEETDTPSWKGVPGSVILISAYDQLKSNTTVISFEATCKLLKQTMRSSNSRVIGVCVYGTKTIGTSKLAVPNIVQLLPLDSPTLEDFKKFKALNVKSYGQANDLKLSEVFWHCSKMFANCKRLLSDRSVIMLTRLDVPPITADQRPTLKRIVDLLHLGINLQIINVSKESYEVHPFYEEMLKTINRTQDDVAIPLPIWNSDKIQNLMQQHSHRHLAVARLKLQIGEKFSIGVGVYNLCKTHGMPKKITLNRETNETVTSNITNLKVHQCNPIGHSDSLPKEVPLLKSEILFFQEYGNEKIEFTTEEMMQMKNPFGPPMMKLLGFKPKHILSQEKWFLKECAFLFPNEVIVEGSTVAFKALHAACSEMSVVAICILCTRVGAKPRIVALSPCVKPFGLNIEIGFDIIHIPFLENLKDVPSYNDEAQVNIDECHSLYMNDVINTLKFDYKLETFENPKLQCLYRAIEALALEEKKVESFVDTTKRDQSKLDSVDSEMFNELFGPFECGAPKRASSLKDPGPIAKRMPTGIDQNQLQTRIDAKEVNKYTVNELKQILKSKKSPNIPALTGLKKEELVRLVYEFANKE